MTEAQIPHPYTFGNHDDEGDLTRRQIVRLDQTNPYSLRNESEGIPDTANFRLPVYASQNDSQLAAHLWVHTDVKMYQLDLDALKAMWLIVWWGITKD